MDDDHLAVDDRLTGNVESGSDRREPFGPVQTVAGIDLLATTVGMNLNAVAVVLDFVKPLSPFGAFDFRVASWGLMNPGMVEWVRFGNYSTHKQYA